MGLPLGCAEIGAQLWGKHLSYNPDDPQWLNRDRFILSAGHGSMFIYSWLHLSGYALPMEEVKNFRRHHSMTPGHPEFPSSEHNTPGIEATTGPLGAGIGNAVGMAAAAKVLHKSLSAKELIYRLPLFSSCADLIATPVFRLLAPSTTLMAIPLLTTTSLPFAVMDVSRRVFHSRPALMPATTVLIT